MCLAHDADSHNSLLSSAIHINVGERSSLQDSIMKLPVHETMQGNVDHIHSLIMMLSWAADPFLDGVIMNVHQAGVAKEFLNHTEESADAPAQILRVLK